MYKRISDLFDLRIYLEANYFAVAAAQEPLREQAQEPLREQALQYLQEPAEQQALLL